MQAIGQDHFFVNVLVRLSHLVWIFPAFSGGLPGVGHQLMYQFWHSGKREQVPAPWGLVLAVLLLCGVCSARQPCARSSSLWAFFLFSGVSLRITVRSLAILMWLEDLLLKGSFVILCSAWIAQQRENRPYCTRHPKMPAASATVLRLMAGKGVPKPLIFFFFNSFCFKALS